MKKLFTVIMVIAILSLVGHAQTADEVVNDYLKANNVKKMRTMKTMEAKSNMQDNRGNQIQMTIWLKRPNMVRSEIVVGGQTAIQAYDGKTTWQIMPRTGSLDPMELTGEAAQQVKDTFEMLEDPLMDYKKKGHTVELLGKEEEEGKTYFKLKLTKEGKRESTMFIDTKTLLLHKISLIQSQGGMEFPMDLVFDDYKDVIGVKINHKLSAFVRGQNIWNMDFEHFKANVPVDDAIFVMPKKKEEKEEKEEKESK